MSYTIENFLNKEILIKIEKHQIKDFLKKFPESILWRSKDKPLAYIPPEEEFPITLIYGKDGLSYWPAFWCINRVKYPHIINAEDIVFEEAIPSYPFDKSIAKFLTEKCR